MSFAAMDWKKSPFTERDAIDLARTVGDRLTSFSRDDMMRAYHNWKKGAAPAEEALCKVSAWRRMGSLMADILALHTDYSLAESFDRLNAIEPVLNPNFPKVLVENATCGYCASHQYESAEYWYKPAIREFAAVIEEKVRANDLSALPKMPSLEEYRDAHMFAKPLDAMRPTLPRTQENFSRTLNAFADAATHLSATPI